MARLRDASAYRKVKKAYVRTSKYRKHNFIRGVPGSKVVMYDVGNKKRDFPCSVLIRAKVGINLRHNAIEAARIAATKHIEKAIGKENFHLKIRVVPHHIMRENPLATGAGADRFQEGMRHAFGKPIGYSARVKKGMPMFQIFIEEENIAHAKEALRKAISKFPIACTYEIIR